MTSMYPFTTRGEEHMRLCNDVSLFCGCYPCASWSRYMNYETDCLVGCLPCGSNERPFSDFVCISGCFPLAYLFCGPYERGESDAWPGCGLCCIHTIDCRRIFKGMVTPIVQPHT